MAKSKSVETTVRQGLELSQNLPFEAIIEKHPEYDFCIINDAKASVQRHEMQGWKVWKGDSLFDTEFENAGKEQASTTRDGFTSVPCGIAGDGKPTRAYLMYAPKGTIDSIVTKRHNENAHRKQSYGSTARSNASSKEGGVESYAPKGFGTDGMKHMPNTVIQNQS